MSQDHSRRNATHDEVPLKDIAEGLRGVADDLDESDADAWRTRIVTLRDIADDLFARSEKPAHTDHPLRHWDRTCPACLAEQQDNAGGTLSAPHGQVETPSASNLPPAPEAPPVVSDAQRVLGDGVTAYTSSDSTAAPAEKTGESMTTYEVADIINKEPLIQSLLYDIDLLPEQIKEGDSRRYSYMLAVIGHMKEALKAQSATTAIPEGWVLVPVEPTGAMLSAMWTNLIGPGERGIVASYAAILAAAPSPTSNEEPK